MKISSTPQLWIASLRGQRRSLVSFVGGVAGNPMVGQFEAALRPSMRVFKICTRGWKSFEGAIPSKRYNKSGKNARVLLDSSQLLDVKFRRDQDLKHLMVTKSSIRTGSGIDYPKVESEPIKSHHKILTRNDRIPSRFACRCRLRLSDVAKRTSDLLFEFFMRSSSKFWWGDSMRRDSIFLANKLIK